MMKTFQPNEIFVAWTNSRTHFTEQQTVVTQGVVN